MIFKFNKNQPNSCKNIKLPASFYVKGWMACAMLSQNFAIAAQPANALNINDAMLCVQAAKRYEYEFEIPKNLLYAISVTESGRWHAKAKQVLPWPWTVSLAGKAHFFNNAQETSAFIRRMMNLGERNIDVGCFQINVHYHGKKFKNIEHMVDPQMNAAYAASFLRSMFATNNNWNQAVARYHSATEHLGSKYLSKVRSIWKGMHPHRASFNSNPVPPVRIKNTKKQANPFAQNLLDKRRRSNMMVYYSGARDIKQFANSNKVAAVSQKALTQ